MSINDLKLKLIENTEASITVFRGNSNNFSTKRIAGTVQNVSKK